MTAPPQASLSRPASRWASPWIVAALFAFAAGLRLWGVGQWSLWQDEEMSIYFSQYQQHLFVRCFPPFFVALGWVYELGGISTATGRMLAGFFGLLGIGLVYGFCRKHLSREIALVAALLLSVALGHVFWSQSIRYYTMVAAAQMISLWWFYEGIEETRYGKLLLSALAFTFSMYVQFTGVLILPVFVGYLLLVFALRQQTPAYHWKPILFFMVLVLLGFAAIFPNYATLSRSGALAGPFGPPHFQPPLPMIVRIFAYYGLPMVGCASLSPLFWNTVPKRAYLLVFSIALIPVLELLVLGIGALAITFWYHGFISMMGAAPLAGVTLIGIYRLGWRKLALSAGILSLLYYAGFLALYYTQMHGDRERWQDGAAYLKRVAQIDPARDDNPVIFATVPEVAAYYLGVPADRARPQGPLVALVPEQPPELGAAPAWFMVKASHVTPEYQAWFQKHCEHKAEFPARTLMIDRTMHVYYWPGRPTTHRISPPPPLVVRSLN